MSFTLADSDALRIPARFQSARVYLSLASPMYSSISSDDTSWSAPELRNPADPNTDVIFDLYEFGYWYTRLPFAGETTQLEMFGIPLTARLTQAATSYDQTVGITLTRAEVRARYQSTVTPEYLQLVTAYRILAPLAAPQSSPLSTFLDPAIDAFWTKYTSEQFLLDLPGWHFTGQVVNDQFHYTANGADSYTLTRPSTPDVFSCSGTLLPGPSPAEQTLAAELCAAFNRGVASTPSSWHTPAGYYPVGTPANEYARSFHSVGLQGLAYAFPYDDVDNQSPLSILPNTDPPTSLTLTIGW